MAWPASSRERLTTTAARRPASSSTWPPELAPEHEAAEQRQQDAAQAEGKEERGNTLPVDGDAVAAQEPMVRPLQADDFGQAASDQDLTKRHQFDERVDVAAVANREFEVGVVPAIGELRSVEAEDLEVVDDLEACRHDDAGGEALDDLDQTVLSRRDHEHHA